MEFIFGMPVVGSDGAECGTLDHVLVDLDRREVTHVVVSSPKVSEDLLFPLSLVQGSAELRLLLHAAGTDLGNMPRYYQGRTSSPPSGRVDTTVVRESAERRQDLEAALNVPINACEYGPETRVSTADTEGQLVSLSADQYTNRVSELLASGLLEQEIVVSERWIGDLHPDAISLTATRDQLDQLIAAQAGLYVARQSGSPSEVIERRPES
jgi:hypothetical protein